MPQDSPKLSPARQPSEPAGPWPLDPGLTNACRDLGPESPLLITGLEGAARAFTLARLWHNRKQCWLVVCPTLPMAEALAKDLEFFLPGANEGRSPVRLYPSYEVSPYREVEPPAEITARRMAVLWEMISSEEPLIVVTSAKGLSPRLCPPEHLLDSAVTLTTGKETPRQEFIQALINGGYTRVPLVEQVGDFAVRGSVLDFYGPLMDEPVRVEFFDDEVDSLRRFDPIDQRSQLPLNEATLIPCLPVDLSKEVTQKAVKAVRKLVREEELSSKRLAIMVERMEQQATFPGLDGLLPLYHPVGSDIFSFMPDDCLNILVEPAEIRKRLEAEQSDLEEEFTEARDEGRIVLPPAHLRRTPDQVAKRLKSAPRVMMKALAIGEQEAGSRATALAMKADIHTGLHESLSKGGDGSVITKFLEWAEAGREQGRDVVLICRSRSQIDRLAEILAEREVAVSVIARADQAPGGGGGLHLLLGGLTGGFKPLDAALIYVTEDEVFGAPRVVRQKAPPKLSEMLAALDDLAPGEHIVHVDHGIGVYHGLETLAVGAAESDFLLITYKGGDKLYLPADRMGLISKYRGPGEQKPSLDRLGGKAWQRTKSRVKKAVEAIAKDLVDLYAARSFQKGHAYSEPDQSYREFEASFPYEETPDQAKAIEDVIADLNAPRPMDRLVCGDVGFGKTEVALRACFMVAMQGRQAALLVPTTVLAEQHFATFKARLAQYPLEVRSISRFKTPVEQKKILAELKAGKVDIVIGTHRLLQKDVLFKDLGLIVADEEQRFGVSDKEKLKKMRRLVDVLALTATPIPRTLQMSLSGIRDMSLITTPPEERQAIKTYLAKFSPQNVKQALERELKRGGQVFYVHNRVHDIQRQAGLIKRLAPDARVGIAHGQMSEKALEKVMMQFVRREIDVLVCTTIIESGLDIPSANTIIIHEADKLGLSQIYQLRGRVGRANQRAYAYLFIKSEAGISRDAKKRLKALMDFTHLGAGFAIAMHDLQIRGAGNMLGEAQSGRANDVGYELYVQMLEEAVARLKGEAPAEGPEPEMRLAMPAGLPEDYVPDGQVRLNLYRRLSRMRSAEEMAGLKAEISDRFGPPPPQVETLLRSVSLKGLLRRLGATSLDVSGTGAKIQFASEPRIDLDRLLALAARPQEGVTVYPSGQVNLVCQKGEEPLARVRQFLQYIGADGN